LALGTLAGTPNLLWTTKKTMYLEWSRPGHLFVIVSDILSGNIWKCIWIPVQIRREVSNLHQALAGIRCEFMMWMLHHRWGRRRPAGWRKMS
jgi:hypothetical protein